MLPATGDSIWATLPGTCWLSQSLPSSSGEDNTQVNQHQVVIFEKKEQGSDVTTAPRVGNTRWAVQGGLSKEVDNGAET